MNSSSTTPSVVSHWSDSDLAGWLIAGAQDALKRTEENGEDPENLLLTLQPSALLTIAVQKLQVTS
ncbi:MAG: hypothetical protein ACRDQ2_15940 [Gaiellales bacterium]